jgi:putative two-component system response regulator
VLIVDDQEPQARLLARLLDPETYRVRFAHSGEEALTEVANDPPDVMLLDVVMPGLSGIDVCRVIKEDPTTLHIPIIMVTGQSEQALCVEATEAGADDFLSRPFNQVRLHARLRQSLRSKLLHDELVAHKDELERRVAERTAEIQRTQQVTVFSMAKLAESRDTETGNHLIRMRSYARELADEMSTWPEYFGRIDGAFVEDVYASCPLHDIGKVGIPDQILLKPGKLTDDEMSIMKKHSLIGGDTLRAADLEAGSNSFLAMARDIAYFHHERWDGGGYPFGRKQRQIPLAARIAALADVYDALSSRRPYKEPFSHEKSREIILSESGTHFDPDVVRAFLAREEAFISIRQQFQDWGQLSPLQQVFAELEDSRQRVAEA